MRALLRFTDLILFLHGGYWNQEEGVPKTE